MEASWTKKITYELESIERVHGSLCVRFIVGCRVLLELRQDLTNRHGSECSIERSYFLDRPFKKVGCLLNIFFQPPQISIHLFPTH